MRLANNLIRRLLPKEERFRELLARDTANLARALGLFSEIAHAESFEERRVKVVELKALEHQGDLVTRQVFEALNSVFITPFDRDDIRALASGLDDVLDSVEGVAQSLVTLELEESPEALRQFADILVAMGAEIDRGLGLVWDLTDAGAMQSALVRISDLENQGDALYNAVITNLFNSPGRSPLEVMKWKEVHDGLENACDQCRDLAHVLGNVVLKSS